MPNSKLENKMYPVPEHLQRFLGNTISYANLKMTKTRLNRAKTSDLNQFHGKGGDNALKWVESTLKTDRNAIHAVKQIGMKTGRENQFLKTHEKDKSANPTAVGGLPKMNKGDISRKIIDNKEVYNEGLAKEILEIKYLIEYMNNNKQKI